MFEFISDDDWDVLEVYLMLVGYFYLWWMEEVVRVIGFCFGGYFFLEMGWMFD